MFKKIALTSVVVLALAGCAATTDTATPAPAPAPAVTTAPAPVASPEETFLADVHGMNDPYIESTTDSDLLDIGNATCTALDDGNTIADIVTYLTTNGTFSSTGQARAGGMIIAAAAMDLCPEYAADVAAYANS